MVSDYMAAYDGGFNLCTEMVFYLYNHPSVNAVFYNADSYYAVFRGYKSRFLLSDLTA